MDSVPAFTRPVKTCERVTTQLGPVSGGFLLQIGAGKLTKSYAVYPAASDFGTASRFGFGLLSAIVSFPFLPPRQFRMSARIA
jgi:hypothetical protein